MRTRIIVALGLLVVGCIWIGQGLGMVRAGTFMVDDIRWAVAGAVMVAVGLVLLVSARSRRPPA